MKYYLQKNNVKRLMVLFFLTVFLTNIFSVTMTDQTVSAQEMMNTAPFYDAPTPVSGKTNMPLSFSFAIPITDFEGDTFDWFITCSNGQVASGFDEGNGTKTLELKNLDFGTTYYLWVNATDGENTSNAQYKYTTRPSFLPVAPSNFDSLTSTETQIDLSWERGDNADRTYIEWNVVPGWRRGLGTMIYNGTDTSFSHTDLVAHRRYFYQAWSYNETDKVYSTDYALSDAYRFGYLPEDGEASPIRKFFTTQKILWTFDDYMITANHHPPHLGFTVIPEVVIGYGGQVNIMTILFGINEAPEYKNYSVVEDLGWSQEKINKSLDYFKQENIHPACHGWDYRYTPLNTATLDSAYEYINFTMWNWVNNFGIKPHFFLGGSTSGNLNITLALKKFSENYWPVYGEDFRWEEPDKFPETSRDSPAVEFINKYEYVTLFDPLFGCSWGTPCTTVEEAQELFDQETEGKEILFIRGHPKYFDGSDPSVVENISLWKNWIDWIYQNHDLININHTQAIEYNVDRYSYKVYKNSVRNYSIDLTDCEYDHDIIFSQPYKNLEITWELYDAFDGTKITEILDDTTVPLDAGGMYYFISDDEALDEMEENDNETDTPGFTVVIGLVSMLVICILYFLKRRE